MSSFGHFGAALLYLVSTGKRMWIGVCTIRSNQAWELLAVTVRSNPGSEGENCVPGKKKRRKTENREAGAPKKLSRTEFEQTLSKLQVELVKLQNWVKHKGLRVVVIFEGRDAAGKGGAIKRITERVSPRVFRVVALPAPNERENLLRYSLKMKQSNHTTTVDVSHQVELRRTRAWELHPGVGLMTEARLSNALQRRINEAIEEFLQRVKEKLENGANC